MEILDTSDIVEDTDSITEGSRKPIEELIEEFVDEEYKRDNITPKCEKFWKDIQNHFGSGQLVSFKEIAEYSATKGVNYPAAVTWMRMLWKAGYVRRFFKGYFIKAYIQKTSTGTKYGIHYLW